MLARRSPYVPQCASPATTPAPTPSLRTSQDHGHVVHIHMIGVRVQGQGMGAQLIQHIKDQAAKAGRGVYLEASSAASTRFYSRHGFQHVREHRLHEAAPILNLMAYHPEV